jgi:hypothetical protein
MALVCVGPKFACRPSGESDDLLCGPAVWLASYDVVFAYQGVRRYSVTG